MFPLDKEHNLRRDFPKTPMVSMQIQIPFYLPFRIKKPKDNARNCVVPQTKPPHHQPQQKNSRTSSKRWAIGVPWWLSRLRTWHCHCSGSGYCCGVDSIPSQGTYAYCGHALPPKKMKKQVQQGEPTDKEELTKSQSKASMWSRLRQAVSLCLRFLLLLTSVPGHVSTLQGNTNTSRMTTESQPSIAEGNKFCE